MYLEGTPKTVFASSVGLQSSTTFSMLRGFTATAIARLKRGQRSMMQSH